MVVRKRSLSNSERMVCDGLSVGVCASDSDAAGHRSLPAGRLGQEHHHHHSGADGGQGTGPQHTPWAGTRSITHVCGGRRQQSRRSAPSWTVSIGGVWG